MRLQRSVQPPRQRLTITVYADPRDHRATREDSLRSTWLAIGFIVGVVASATWWA